MIYMHIYRLVELKKLSNKVQTAKSETLGFYLIMGTLLTKLAMLKSQFIRRTHCSNRSCFSGRPTKGLPRALPFLADLLRRGPGLLQLLQEN